MSNPLDIRPGDGETQLQAAIWSTFLTARLAYIEHQSEVTRSTVQAAYRAYALAAGLSLDRAQQACARLDAVNAWEQSPSVLIGAAA